MEQLQGNREPHELASQIAHLIVQDFDQYMWDFREVTARAPIRFQNRDWHGIQADQKKRMSLYKRRISRIARKIQREMGKDAANDSLWQLVKAQYKALSLLRYEYELSESFYNSVCRKVIGNMGADIDCMFVEDEHLHREFRSEAPIFRRFEWQEPNVKLMEKLLLSLPIKGEFEDVSRDAAYISGRLEEDVLFSYKPDKESHIDLLESVFYRNKGAYVVGRFWISDRYLPFIIPLLHNQNGVFADTLITDTDTASIIFSFTRSYFMVDVSIPSEFVHFLKTIMPEKPYGDLYNSIGFSKHGKTEMYRNFVQHLKSSTDQFVIAPGIKGMVMSVFTLPSYNIVFKLIKDQFDPPKTTNKAHVKSRYKLVSMHDRVGRMADTHEFEHFVFPRERFSQELIDELLTVASSIIHLTDEHVVIDHLYTERKMTPLNLFLEDANPDEAEEVVEEYGNTIKQLAAANIFPGDMLLKNFGVTRHRRVVFYDYDEIGFLTDYHFRWLPEAEGPEDIYASGPWFAVGPNDVFPEEFKHFLIGREDIREIFFELHADLFEPKFWIDMQQKQINKEIVDVFPYRRRQRFSNAVC
ncbi:bifunctional isocitrate dehydrogenase kinase/phosphatase [Pontibacter sp. G13]|uniref:bifunctional isocitrate dehydrogenase kinase/phosphatase n=1 Tax=Pontibacter sp. G13 TaxID=3074898 RepID=UPI002889020E|nr:bifunctional isocitrate dehydrogenase kinase/phosphatase [Pontibacter sp. G13]WNJ16662.1 bifunctional isocitrate dehydrogenase kinase/phosphatase [Pontibacter sp. G13]